MYTWKNQLQHNLPTPAQQKTRGGEQSDSQLTSWWDGCTIERPKTTKTKDIHRANINHSPRSVRSGDQRDCTTESHRYSATEVYTINPGAQNRSTEKAEAKKKSLRNNGETKKQSPNESKGGSVINNAK